MSKIIVGSSGKKFSLSWGDLGIIFREQGSTDPTGGLPNGNGIEQQTHELSVFESLTFGANLYQL